VSEIMAVSISRPSMGIFLPIQEESELETIFGSDSMKFVKLIDWIYKTTIEPIYSISVEELEAVFDKKAQIYAYYSGIFTAYVLSREDEKFKKTYDEWLKRAYERDKERIREKCFSLGVDEEDLLYSFSICLEASTFLSELNEEANWLLMERGFDEFNRMSFYLLSLHYAVEASFALILDSEETDIEVIKWVLRRCMDYQEIVESYLRTLEIIVDSESYNSLKEAERSAREERLLTYKEIFDA
jgi:hypothetical protein